MNTYTDTTGLLVFDGKPQPNRRLMAWLSDLVRTSGDPASPALCEVTAEQTGLVYFTQDSAKGLVCVEISSEGESDERTFGDDAFLQAAHLALAEMELGPEDEFEDLMERLGEAYGQEDYVASLVEKYSEGDSMDVATQVELAMRFSGEHNMCAAMVQSGYHSDRMRLWAFGGYNELVIRKADGAVETVDFSPLSEMLTAFQKFHEESSTVVSRRDKLGESSGGSASGVKIAYAECCASAFTAPPTFARFQVNEAMVKELRGLASLAQASGLDEVRFSQRASFEFCTDDSSGGMDTGSTDRWVVSSRGEFWLDGSTDMDEHIQTRPMSIDELEQALRSSESVIVIQQSSASGAEFLLEVAQKMNEQIESGAFDWSDELQPVVQTLCALDPSLSEDYRELLPLSQATTERGRA